MSTILKTFGNLCQHLTTFANLCQLLGAFGYIWQFCQILPTFDNVVNFRQFLEIIGNFWLLLSCQHVILSYCYLAILSRCPLSNCHPVLLVILSVCQLVNLPACKFDSLSACAASSLFVYRPFSMALLGVGIGNTKYNLSNQSIHRKDFVLYNSECTYHTCRTMWQNKTSYHRVGSQKEALLWMAKSLRVVELSWQIQFSVALLPSCCTLKSACWQLCQSLPPDPICLHVFF